MHIKSLAARAVGAVAVLAFASAAVAQTPPAKPAVAPAKPAQLPVTHGAPVPGLCIYDVNAVVGSSTVGKYVDTRLDQIAKIIDTELNTEEQAINKEAGALQTAANVPGADEATMQKRAVDLKARAKAWENKANLRKREYQATAQKAGVRILTEADPIIVQVYQQRACSILIRRDSVALGNPAMDITPAVITALNAKIQQFPFDRERMDQPKLPVPPAKPN
jgi:Skp family chaperone for outer membrane proteins